MEQEQLLGICSEQDDVLAIAGMSEGKTYSLGFPLWAKENWGIVKAFITEADRVVARGRDHYSARTICEVIRHESALRDAGGIFKIDNNHVPDLARLYMEVRDKAGFFELRSR